MGWLGEGFGRRGGRHRSEEGWRGAERGDGGVDGGVGDEVAARGLCMMNWIEGDLSTEEKQHIRLDR